MLLVVISHLSVGSHAVDEETFQSTMKYIFSFIEKVFIYPLIPRKLTVDIFRKNKLRTSSRNFVKGSAWLRSHVNGVISPSACHSCPINQSDR